MSLRKIQNFGEQHPEFLKARRESKRIQKRLKYLRREIEAEIISYGEIAELQNLAQYIDPSDVLLLVWAGVPEFK